LLQLSFGHAGGTLESHLELHGDAGRANVATKSWPGRVEILSAYLGSFGVGGVGVNRAFRSEAIRSLIEMSAQYGGREPRQTETEEAEIVN
jgi:hypothetical protein